MPGADVPLVELLGQNLLLSVIKAPEDQAKDALVVRLWNASDTVQTGALRTRFSIAKVCRTALDETNAQPLACTAHEINLKVKPWEIITLKLWKADR